MASSPLLGRREAEELGRRERLVAASPDVEAKEVCEGDRARREPSPRSELFDEPSTGVIRRDLKGSEPDLSRGVTAGEG